jgi:hypothetical protein
MRFFYSLEGIILAIGYMPMNLIIQASKKGRS